MTSMFSSGVLQHYLQGNPESKTLIVFLQGWPDNHKMWDQISWQKDLTQHRLLFIDFPNTTVTQPEVKWGVDFPQIVERIHETVQSVGQFERKIMVAHDWGCFYGYMFDQKYPRQFSELIVLDVPAKVELTTITQKLMVFAYQFWLIMAFLIGGRVGKFMTQRFAKLSKHNPPYFDEITASRNYPYFYLYRNILISLFRRNKRFLAGYNPSVPVVYLYGKKKPFNFHGPKWLNYLKTTPDCEAHGLDAGHWFMKKFNQFIVGTINRRLAPKI